MRLIADISPKPMDGRRRWKTGLRDEISPTLSSDIACRVCSSCFSHNWRPRPHLCPSCLSSPSIHYSLPSRSLPLLPSFLTRRPFRSFLSSPAATMMTLHLIALDRPTDRPTDAAVARSAPPPKKCTLNHLADFSYFYTYHSDR